MSRVRTIQRAGWAATAVLAALPVLAAEKKPVPAPPPDLQPAVSIPVDPMGYQPPGAFYLTYRLSSAALDFFDDDHLLFTFRMGGLLTRVPGDPASDDDQEIRAVVLDLKAGRVIRQAKWRMHDRSQYLWPYKDGQFLVRVRDSLFLIDETLELRPFMTFHDGIRAIQVSSNRKLLVVETNDPIKLQQQEPLGPRRLGQLQPVKVMIYPLGEKTPMDETEGNAATLLPLTGDGLLDLLEGRAQGRWVLRDVPFDGAPRIVADVKSSCQPSARPLSANVVLVVGCYGDADDRQVIAVSTDGAGELWRDRWQNRFVWGWFNSAENGSRFLYESIEVSRPISSFDALYPEDIQAQIAGVYDTESGKLVLVRDASPVLTAGQNVALSPDGKRFAILRNGAVEVYDLPPVPAPLPEKKPPEMVAKKKGEK
ncbi:MAG TPA: hypothetical protein VL990_03390 [Acidobacteriaceae bacterium]|nr:hypothetical protein [Acidobacteriaceae bacterium]